MKRTILSVLLTSLLGFSPLLAQRGTLRALEDPNILQIETITLPSQEASKGRLDVLYRLPRRFFVFVRPEPITQAAPFAARAEIALELSDSAGRSTARDFSAREFSSPSPQAASEGSEVGHASFLVPLGRYSLFVEVRDRESNRATRVNIPLTVSVPRESTFASGILLCTPSAADVRPMNHGGDIPLGTRADAWFMLAAADTPGTCSVRYRILRSPSESHDSALVAADSILALSPVPARALVRAGIDTAIRYEETGEALHGMYRIRIPMSIDTLGQGKYSLEVSVRSGTQEWRGSRLFSIRWFDMPLSLRYVESAVEPLEYLLTADEFQRLRRSDAKTQKAYFDAYWKGLDNTPGTAYNEVLAEFYRRVDYARRTFNTLKHENGAKSERGKAYILYGPPSKIDRTLLTASAPQEVWYYPALRRKLTFVDRGKTGDYTLVAAEQL
jgi:GWxTD domain-containing protein